MNRLVVAKIGEDYLRFSGDRFECCTLGKASVFPESEAMELQRLLAGFGEQAAEARLILLTILEQPYGG